MLCSGVRRRVAVECGNRAVYAYIYTTRYCGHNNENAVCGIYEATTVAYVQQKNIITRPAVVPVVVGARGGGSSSRKQEAFSGSAGTVIAKNVNRFRRGGRLTRPTDLPPSYARGEEVRVAQDCVSMCLSV